MKNRNNAMDYSVIVQLYLYIENYFDYSILRN